ncbi:uncharacterized protein LOC124405374 [Diprion similis]|uniref:uncharacterized protein LOC124405374 n=1 Tax=Diprion similis TaxID=362088 RepID=UPI001EF8DDD9|nr:uncharacterized protein LOC124405374 [Diprion similis]
MFQSPGCLLYLLAVCAMLQFGHGDQCLTRRIFKEVTPKRIVQSEGKSLDIRFELSRRVTQRLTSRIMKIFLTEVLGYSAVSLVEKDDHFNAAEVFGRLSEAQHPESIIPETMVNMEVWLPVQTDTAVYMEYYHVKECGFAAPPGYFGWFVPRKLWKSNRMSSSWEMFADSERASNFQPENEIIDEIKKATLIPGSNYQHYCTQKDKCQEGFYVPDRCAKKKSSSSTNTLLGDDEERGVTDSCALLLTSDPDVTSFVKDDIERLKLYVKVAWVGPHLKNLTEWITDRYAGSKSNRSLVILHWNPSDLVPSDRDFVSVDFPRCDLNDEKCPYGSNRLTKLVWAELEKIAKIAYQTIKNAYFNSSMYQDLIASYNNDTSEEKVACDWLNRNLEWTLKNWGTEDKNKTVLTIGGIFPMTGSSYKARSILVAANMATESVNSNNTILKDYSVDLLAHDGQCKSDMVMKSFIDYIIYRYQTLIGILGPACSETLEPLIGVSKQYNTMIVSYSAEGSSFDDRTSYPYFFRTIGENKQYKHVYLQLLEKMGWRRVAALTEDGQKYTEYISHMQDFLQENGITFVDNAKYPRDREIDVMRRYLDNLKKKRARIIIADVYDEVARQVMCQAYKLEMTAYHGYVWFLPLWLLPGWYETERYNAEGETVPCSNAEMAKAVNGYLGITHSFWAPDDEIMQENITVKEWRQRYEAKCEKQNLLPSDYAGYAYDATWTYAYAMDQLLAENESYVFALHHEQTAKRLKDIISRTDFYGVSGRIKFLGGASRISVVEIVQHVNNETKKIGLFHPNVSDTHNEVMGGHLDLNMSAIVWLTGEKPDDGTLKPDKCVFSSIAELLDVTCEVAIIIVNIIGFSCLGILLIAGFVVIKRKYDEKVRLHERYMKSLGIDLLQTDTSGLDKWEIPRECVVINRKLGEGAFGTVYGGEAFFAEKGWLAVAVKTLKVGSSTEEKLDFLSEVEVMKRFEHKNIIKLLGVCIKCEPVYTVMEFMLYGDLKTYLLARRHLVNDRNYEESDEISSKKLTAMALDVARALSYLAQLKYVHRDIASRNCLVNAQRVVKLGDFGMTRPMYENDYYKFNRKGMLPVRWMAPESLGLGIFTPASDVWSYGVLLYEIITFGSFPFQGLSNNEVLEHVKTGHTITIPSGIKAPLENLIRSCWKIDHKLRPNAPEIVDVLATNPRLLSPCLDVPLASVQLEHTGQVDIQLPEKFRKFSVSMRRSSQSAASPSSRTLTTSVVSSKTPLMMGIEDDRRTIGSGRELNRDSFISARPSGFGNLTETTGESSRPLLMTDNGGLPVVENSDSDQKSKYLELQRFVSGGNSADGGDKISARYVNMRPGMDAEIAGICEKNVDHGNVFSTTTTTKTPEARANGDVTEGHDPLIQRAPFL